MDPARSGSSDAPSLAAFSATRYCDTAFPHYRFVPGRNPHPTAHPDGHSFVPEGAAHPAVRFVPPERWSESPDYLYGCDLYNHAYWWEAHEAWEGLWQLTDKKASYGLFLQGLIQSAACHLKLHLGHMRGVERLRLSSMQNLRTAVVELDQDTYLGLNYASFVSDFESYYVPAAGALRDYHDAAAFPYVRPTRPIRS